MHTLSLKIPENLDAALHAYSARHGLSKSAVVRAALEKCLAQEVQLSGASDQWLGRWRGVLGDEVPDLDGDERLAHILDKHLK